MKRIRYRATYQCGDDVTRDDIAVYARSINSGFAKATRYFLRDLPGRPTSWEIVSVEFVEVTS